MRLHTVPLIWVSKLKTEVTLSTTDAEYIALSHSMRELIPCRALLKEIERIVNIEVGRPSFQSTVFEDNTGVINLARLPKMRACTKHSNIKYHHFHNNVRRQEVKVVKINTSEQKVDCLTNPLDRIIFERLRRLLMGW